MFSKYFDERYNFLTFKSSGNFVSPGQSLLAIHCIVDDLLNQAVDYQQISGSSSALFLIFLLFVPQMKI